MLRSRNHIHIKVKILGLVYSPEPRLWEYEVGS